MLRFLAISSAEVWVRRVHSLLTSLFFTVVREYHFFLCSSFVEGVDFIWLSFTVFLWSNRGSNPNQTVHWTRTWKFRSRFDQCPDRTYMSRSRSGKICSGFGPAWGPEMPKAAEVRLPEMVPSRVGTFQHTSSHPTLVTIPAIPSTSAHLGIHVGYW